MLSLMEIFSRMKDYYDIYYLTSKFIFNGKILKVVLAKTFSNHAHIFTEDLFEQMASFSEMDTMQKPFIAAMNETGYM